MISERILKAMKATGLNQADLARIVGISRSATNQWLSGETIPSMKSLMRIEEATMINHKWIETGKGEMLIRSKD